MILTAVLISVLPVQPIHAASKIEGFDVSSYNGVVDWATVTSSDMDFVMLPPLI